MQIVDDVENAYDCKRTLKKANINTLQNIISRKLSQL